MANILDYVLWRNDLSFLQSPMNEVDNLIFTQLVFLDFDGIVPKDGRDSVSLYDAVNSYIKSNPNDTALGILLPKQLRQLAVSMQNSKRYRDLQLSHFVSKTSEANQEQFCAMAIDLPDGCRYLSFRGTDDTIVGWHENFNLGLHFPIPAQKDAVAFALENAKVHDGPLYLGGHSKGGNLAVYAAVFAPEWVQKRISAVYNNDGPGFRHRLQTCSQYKRVQNKITTIVPQSSLVGMLLEHEEHYFIVQSSQTWLWQHDGFSWEVLGPAFVRADQLSDHSKWVDQSLHSWLEQMDDSAREQLIDSLFGVLEASGIKTLTELSSDPIRSVQVLVETLTRMDRENRDRLGKVLPLLLPEFPKLF